jgi:putative hemolysin
MEAALNSPLSDLQSRALTGVRSTTPIRLEREHFLVKTVDSYSELEAALRLRQRVYQAEYGIPAQPYGLDLDAYDPICDHLVIVSKRTGDVVGTYRMLCSNRVNQFYSEQEFELGNLLRVPGIKVELGRACIAPEHRTGTTLALLWRGILAYCQQNEAEFLFGCSSVKVTDPALVARLVLRLEASGHLRLEPGLTSVQPRGDYRMVGLPEAIELERRDPGFAPPPPLSPLLLTYLKAGARILGLPALDREFGCVDFLTVMDLKQMTAAYGRKFST